MKIFKEHIFAFLVSIFVGLVIVGPNLILMEKLGGEYRGIYFQSEAESHYLAWMKEFSEGRGLSNPYLYEFKDNVPSTTFTFGEWFLALPAMFLPIPIPSLNLFYKFFLPFLSALLAYFLLFRLTKDKAWSLAGMLAILLGNVLLSFPDIRHIFHLEMIYGDMAIYARPMNPEFSSIVFFTYLHVFLSALEERRKRWFVFLALLFGLSFYVYFFSCTFLLALNASALGIFIFMKDWDAVKKISGVIGAGFVLALPVFFHYHTLSQHPYYELWKEKSEIVVSHAPIISTVGAAVALLFAFFIFQKKSIGKREYFLGGLLLATFAAVNQQVLTGLLVQPGHYHWYYNTPIYFFLLFVIAKEFSSAWNKKIVAIFLFCAAAAASFAGIFIQYSSYTNQLPKIVSEQRYGTVFDWLNQNTEKDSVVLANEALSEFIPVYTDNNVVWAVYAQTRLVSPERQAFTTDFLVASKDFSRDVKLYRVDYVVWDKTNDPAWGMDTKPSLLPVFEKDGFVIYKVML
jgi:hypothetical protein